MQVVLYNSNNVDANIDNVYILWSDTYLPAIPNLYVDDFWCNLRIS